MKSISILNPPETGLKPESSAFLAMSARHTAKSAARE
jgi:hypothetical protein